MGTNYYLHKNVCPCCKRAEEILHIGKSSAGWCFSLHVDPEKGIASLDDWKRLFPQGEIQDEYRKAIPVEEMLSIICERKWNRVGAFPPHSTYAQEGPNGLLRSRVDGQHCIGNGEGTWDLIRGEFS